MLVQPLAMSTFHFAFVSRTRHKSAAVHARDRLERVLLQPLGHLSCLQSQRLQASGGWPASWNCDRPLNTSRSMTAIWSACCGEDDRQICGVVVLVPSRPHQCEARRARCDSGLKDRPRGTRAERRTRSGCHSHADGSGPTLRTADPAVIPSARTSVSTTPRDVRILPPSRCHCGCRR